MIKELICINCPIGCHLKVDVENKKGSGNNCKRGEEYGINEVTNPLRIVTSTVKIKNGEYDVIPVKTEKAIPKELIFKAMEEINKVIVEAPIKMGDIVIENILNTGVNVIATRDIENKKLP